MNELGGNQITLSLVSGGSYQKNYCRRALNWQQNDY